jgi:DNA-binding response OmpR family regulator
MKNILLCSSDALLVRNLYGILRDEGHVVDTVEHPALAVQKVLNGAFDVIILDSEPFGLSTEDAAQIIRSVRPDLPVICLGQECRHDAAYAVDSPLDVEAFKRKVHAVAV